jgi:hypothetical protein
MKPFNLSQHLTRSELNVMDFGAKGTGLVEDTAAFLAAGLAAQGSMIYVPRGRYLVGNIGSLERAGTRWRAASKYQAVMQPLPGLTGAIFSNLASATGTSADCGLDGFYFDLGGENCTAVDLASVNNSFVRDCHIAGGQAFGQATTNTGSPVVTLTGLGLENTTRLRAGQNLFGPTLPAGAKILTVDNLTQFTMTVNATSSLAGTAIIYAVAGVGVAFGAPLGRGAYTNRVDGCAGQYLNVGVMWGQGANENHVFASEWIGCNYGYYTYNATSTPDTPKVIGGRVEGCNVGVLEGSKGGYYEYRFENCYTCNIEWTALSVNAVYGPGCTSAITVNVHKNRNLAVSPRILAADLGYYDIEATSSRPRLVSGRCTFAAPGVVPVAHALTDYSVHFQNYALFANGISAEYSNAAGDNKIIGLLANATDELEIIGYNRKTAAYVPVKVANVTVTIHPITQTLLIKPGNLAVLGAAGTFGRRGSVLDSTLPATSANFGATIVGGGSNKVPAFDNGVNWIIA